MNSSAKVQKLVTSAAVLIENGQAELARKQLELALNIAPDALEALLIMGLLESRLGQIEESEDLFNKANKIDPNRPFTLANLGRLAFRRGDYIEAMEWFDQTVQSAKTPPPPSIIEQTIEPSELTSIRTYGIMIQNLADRELFEEMAEVIEQATEIHKAAPQIHTQAFSGWLNAGNTKMAADHLAKLIRLKPSLEIVNEAQRHLALCKWMDKSLEETVPAAARRFTAGDNPPLVIAIAAWGESYIADFLNLYLRSMEAPGNLPAISQSFDIIFAVVTTKEGQAQLKNSGIEERLAGTAHFEYFAMPSSMVRRSNHLDSTRFIYRTYIQANHIAIAYAQAIGAAINLGVPDAIVADGAFANLAHWALEEKKQAVFAQGLVVSEETFSQSLLADNNGSRPIAIQARDLMARSAKHLHHLVKNRIVSPSNKDFSEVKSAIFWWGEDGLMGHLIHWHPVYISAERLKKYKDFRYVSIDAILPQLLFPKPDEWNKLHLVTQSDDFGFVTLGPANKSIPSTGKPFDVNAIAQYYHHGIDVREIGRWMFSHKVTYGGFCPSSIPDQEKNYDPRIIDYICRK